MPKDQSHLNSDYIMELFRESLGAKVKDRLTEYATNRKFMRERVAAKSRIDQIVDEVRFAASRFVPSDARSWDLSRIEIEITDFSDGSQATQDLKLYSLDGALCVNVVDWKRVGKLNDAKIARYKNGDQPWLYTQKAQNADPDHTVQFEFRFLVVAFSSTHTPFLHVEEVAINAAMHAEKSIEYTLQTERIQRYNELGAWPRNEQHCFAYNSTCAFLRDCWRYEEDAEPFSGKLNSPIRSQSMNTTERQCPRLYFFSCAAAEKTGDDYHDIGPSGEPAVWGTMFHEGMAMVYQEIKQNHV